ncbi:MAG: hypothetical protein WCK13_12215 [Ignavibacteriota bacterium]
MNKVLKYYVLFPLLIVSAAVLSVIVGYKAYNINSYKVYLVSPDNSILVSTEFPATILIKGRRTPDVVEIYVDDKLTEIKMFNNLNYTDLGELKIANFRIDPLYLSSGKHNFSVLLKGSMFLKDSKISADFIYEKKNNFSYVTEKDKVSLVRKFFAEDVSQLIVTLNDAREYYTNSDWKTSAKYTAQKKKVMDADVEQSVNSKLSDVIAAIENKSSIDSIYNTTNALNVELYNRGYPITNLMFEYRYKNRNSNSLLMSYEISDSVMIEKENLPSIVHVIKRVDGINVKEQFLGIKLPNSPFAFILDESMSLLTERYLRIFNPDEAVAKKEISRMTNGYVKNNEDAVYLLGKVKEETQKYISNRTFVEMLKKSNAYHEIRHLNDYKEARRIGKSVPEVLNYFYGDVKKGNFFSLDSSFKVERDICETLLKVNPEFSAYLYELANSKGLRRLVLLNLFEKLVNADKDETSHQWAAKLILYHLAKLNGYVTKDLISLPLEGNEEEWYTILKKLMDIPIEHLERDSVRLLMLEFEM